MAGKTLVSYALKICPSTAPNAELDTEKRLKQHGILRDEADGDIMMQITAQEEKLELYHNIKYLLTNYRNLICEVTLKQEQRVKYFGRDQYYDSFCEQMKQSLKTLVDIIDDLPKWCEQGEEYKRVLYARYIDGREPEKNPWEKLQIKRSTYFLHLSAATEKVQEMFFGDSAKELVRLLILSTGAEKYRTMSQTPIKNT